MTVDGSADIKVYRGEKLVCSVTDGIVSGDLIALTDGSTRIYLSGAEDYRISITGRQDTLTYTVQTRSDGRSIKKAKMQLTSADGRTFTGNIPMSADSKAADYRLS